LEHYRRLGFEVRAYDGGGEYGFVRRDGVELHIGYESDHDPARTAAAVYVDVEDADELYAEWAGTGVGGRLVEPSDQEYGIREGAHVDPDGNLLRFGSPVSRRWLKLLDRALRYAEGVFAGIPDDRRGDGTPCPGQSVEVLAGHLVGGLGWFGGLPGGGTKDPTATPDPDLAGWSLVEAFRAAAGTVRREWTVERLDDYFELPVGEVTGAGLTAYMVVEVLGHGWDLAVASGQAARPAEDLAEDALALARGLGEEYLRTPGMMGEPVAVPDGAPAVDRFVAFLGRTPETR